MVFSTFRLSTLSLNVENTMEYFINYCQSHITLLWIWIMLWPYLWTRTHATLWWGNPLKFSPNRINTMENMDISTMDLAITSQGYNKDMPHIRLVNPWLVRRISFLFLGVAQLRRQGFKKNESQFISWIKTSPTFNETNIHLALLVKFNNKLIEKGRGWNMIK